MTYTAIQNKIDSVARPSGFRNSSWRALKKMAFLIWEEHLNGTGWRGAVKVPCKEFYYMLLDEKGSCVVPYQTQLVWTDTPFNKAYVQELNEQGLSKAKMGLWDRAQVMFERALNIMPYSYESLCYKGLIQQKAKSFQAAMETFETAINVAPDRAMAFLYRSKLYSLLDMDKRAMDDMNRAIRLEPGSAAMFARRSELQVTEGNSAAALFDLKMAISLQPNSLKLRWKLAVMLEESNQMTSAIQAYKVIAKMDSQNAEAQFYLAMLLSRENRDIEQVRDLLNQAITLGHGQAESAMKRLFPNAYLYRNVA